jgi:ectoine hydroxylase-related dioxygenase (phytanoyl-CoA dioxygenase family)
LADQRADPNLAPFSISPRDVPCFPLESEPGDVVFFDQNLWHASFGGRSGRRMFTLNFGARPTEDEHVAFLQRVYQNNLVFAKDMQATQPSHLYEKSFLYSDRPRIQGMVKPILELGFK